MAYTPTTWTDRNVQYPRRYTDELSNVKTFTPNEGTISNAGTAVTAAVMNNIETGIQENRQARSSYLYNTISGGL